MDGDDIYNTTIEYFLEMYNATILITVISKNLRMSGNEIEIYQPLNNMYYDEIINNTIWYS